MTIKLDQSAGQLLPSQISGAGDNLGEDESLDQSGLKKVAQDFESIFLDSVLKSMRKSVVKSGFIDGGHAEEMYQGMLDNEYAKVMASQGQTGLSQLIEKQLSQDTSSSVSKSINSMDREAGKRIYEKLNAQDHSLENLKHLK